MEARRSSYFREKVRGLFLNCFLKDWETLCVRASGGNSHNHRRDRVCRSRFFRGNGIVKAMSAPDRSGRGGSRRLALWQRCCLDAPSANVGPLAGIAEKRPVVRRGVGDGNWFGPHLADMSDLRVALSPCRLPARNRAFSAFRVLETDRPAGRPACFFVPVGANPVERDGARLRRFPPRGSMTSCSLSFRRLPVVQARGSTTGSCLPALRRVWPLPEARNGPGERRPGSQPIVDRRERVLARPEDRTAWVFCVRAARTLPFSAKRAVPLVPAYLQIATRHSAAIPDLEIGERAPSVRQQFPLRLEPFEKYRV